MDGAQETSKNTRKDKPIGFGHKVSPEERANILSKLTFWWATRLPIFARRNVLQLEHLWEVTRIDSARNVRDEVEKQWQYQLTLPQPAFGRALWDSYKFYYFKCFFFMLLSIGAQMAQPELLSRLTEWVTEKHLGIPHDENSGYLYAMGMFLIAMFGSICTYQANYNGIRAGSSLRSAVVTNVYRKSLRLSNGAKNKTSQGNIVNNDAQRLVDTSVFLTNVIAAPVQVVASIILLYFKIGWPTFVALGFMIVCMPINGYTARRMGAFRWGMVQKSDLRVKVTTEIIQFIKIKLYAWEDSFAQKVITARLAEIAHLRSFNKVRSLLISVISSVPVVSAVLMYCAYWGSGHDLTAAVVFSSLSYLNSLALPFNFIPLLLALLVQMKVATTRVTEFMLLEEMTDIAEIEDAPIPTIKVSGADFDWDVPKDEPKGKATEGKETEAKAEEGKGESGKGEEGKGKENGKEKGKGKKKKGPGGPPGMGPPGMAGEKRKKYPDFTLHDVNLNFTGPQLVAVVGAVGSGKSSLCNSILGEMKLLKGTIGKHGRIAYVPQQAWIINATLRENILFGTEYNEKRYEAVIEACALSPDLKILSAGDLTEIGERGINLSGGQKQRVSIARALYSDADIYVLDDPLSAVDAHVAKHLFYQCIRKYLTGKLVILATNQLQFLPDYVVFLGGDGHTSGQGKFSEIMASNSQFSEMMHIAGGGGSKVEEEQEEKEEEKKPAEITADKPVSDGKLVVMEDRESGSVGWDVYYEYMRNGGVIKGILIICVYCTAVGTNTFLNWWLSHWTSNDATSTRPSYFYFTIYIGIAVFYVMASATRAFTFFDYVTTAALNLHNGLFNRIIRAPMWFFDVTPLGRIINRFSKDIDQIDNMLHMTMDQTINFGLQLLAAIIMISILIPIILAVVAPCVLLYALLQNFYRHTSRELQRIESISRSPIFAQFSETLTGTSSIRAYACTERMIDTNEKLLNSNNKAFFTLQAMNQWLGVRLDLLGNIIVFGTAIFVIVFEGDITSAEAGLALSYALQLTNFLNRATLMSADFETKMNSVERIMHSSNGPVEFTSDPAQDNEKWPSSGEIEFNDYKMRYREGLDLVLRGISCKISTNEKIGIVGRTGAGKSSIVLALFRLVEAAEGNIVLDHTDISQVALKTLRSRIAIIPQDPVLFSGTVRDNLDPFFTLNDNEIWKVLEHIQLKDAVEKAGGLQAAVSENGDNWSVGQRQLICLCRALLRKPKILVLDEATASVDSYTDALIQKTIRTEFSDATILTIAHRLNTIMDSSRIIVMDKGVIAEFDTPAKLMDNPQSHLNWLVDQTGPKNAEVLRNIAYGRATVV